MVMTNDTEAADFHMTAPEEKRKATMEQKPEPTYTREQVEGAFMDEVWDALKADVSDLGKQRRILAAFRRATYTRKQVQQVLEAAAEIADTHRDTCIRCGHQRSNHPYKHPFQSAIGTVIRAIDIDAVVEGE